MGVVIAILYGLVGIFYMREAISEANPKNVPWLVLVAMFWPLLFLTRLYYHVSVFVNTVRINKYRRMAERNGANRDTADVSEYYANETEEPEDVNEEPVDEPVQPAAASKKPTNRVLASVAFSLAMMAVVFISQVYMEVKTGYRFVMLPLEYAIIFAANAFLIFVILVMTAGIKYEFARRHELRLIYLASSIGRVLLIGVAWFVILLAMGVWTHFVSMGRSFLFFVAVIEVFAYSLLKIWNFGR